MTECSRMSKIGVQLPSWVINYFEEKAEKTSIPKTTLIRSFLVERIRESEAQGGVIILPTDRGRDSRTSSQEKKQ